MFIDHFWEDLIYAYHIPEKSTDNSDRHTQYLMTLSKEGIMHEVQHLEGGKKKRNETRPHYYH